MRRVNENGAALIVSALMIVLSASGQVPKPGFCDKGRLQTSLFAESTSIASWERSALPADWKTCRRRWDLLHRWRVVLLMIAFAFLIVGFVGK